MTTSIDNSSINISEDVITSIVSIAINEIDGVSIVEPTIAAKLTKQNNIQCTLTDGSVRVEASVAVKYGSVISDIIKKVQENVASSIEVMTSLDVDSININVIDILY